MPEKSGTKVASGFLGVFTNISFFVALIALGMALTFFNPKYYIKQIVNDDFIDIMYDRLDDEGILDGTNIDPEDAFPRDFIQRYMTDAVSYGFTGASYDEDYYEDYIEDTVVPLIEDERGYSCSRSEIKDMQQDFLDSIEDAFGDMETDSLEQLNEYNNATTVVGIGAIVLAAVFAFLNFVIHRVKARSIKSTATATLIASIFATIIFALLKLAFSQILTEDINEFDKDMRPMVEKLAETFLIEPVVVCAGLVVVSIILIIVGAAGAKAAKKAYLEENPAPVVPVQPAFQPAVPVMPVAPVQPAYAPVQQPVAPAPQPAVNADAAYMPPQMQTAQPVAPVAPVTPEPVAAPVVDEPAPAMVTDPIVDTSASLGLSWICAHGHKNDGGKFCTTCGTMRNI